MKKKKSSNPFTACVFVVEGKPYKFRWLRGSDMIFVDFLDPALAGDAPNHSFIDIEMGSSVDDVKAAIDKYIADKGE